MEKVKSQRTTPQQLEIYLSFVQKNPEIQRNKNDPRNPTRMEDLWKTLASQLNSVKGPSRSAKKWKESLTHWKNQLRSRARKHKADKIATGGGPSRMDELNSFEERAIDTLGGVVIDGLNTLPTLGTDEFEDEMYLIENDPGNIPSSVVTLSPTLGETARNASLAPETVSIPGSKRTQETMFNQVLEMMQRRDQRDADFQREVLNNQVLQLQATNAVIAALKHLPGRSE